MVAGLSLAVLIFLFVVVVPGYAWLTLNGKPEQEIKFESAVLRGSLILCLVLAVLFGRDVLAGTALLVNFFEEMAVLSGLREGTDLAAIAKVFALVYLAALVAAALELGNGLFFKVPGFKLSAKIRNRIGKKFRKSGFRVGPGHSLRDVLHIYRLAGKKPLVKIWFSGGGCGTYECLKYSWNKGESLLVRDADRPEAIEWLSIKDVSRIQFLNFADATKENKRYLTEWDALLLDTAVYPGYSEEVEENFRQRFG